MSGFRHYPVGTSLDEMCLGTCVADGCDAKLLSDYIWRRINRARARSLGFARHDGCDLCTRHYQQALRASMPRQSSGRQSVPPKVRECRTCGVLYATKEARQHNPDIAAKTVRGCAGYCHRHYQQHRRHDDDYLTREERNEMVLEDWVMMRDDGLTDLSIAAGRLGYTVGGLKKLLYRARKVGDPRGSLKPFGRAA